MTRACRIFPCAMAIVVCGVAQARAQTSLGTAQSYAVLGGSAVTNTGPTVLTGDLGSTPSLSISGFPPGTLTGVTHAGDAAALQAQADVTTQFNALGSAACSADLSGQNLGGLTLIPGVYCFSSSAQLTGALTLNAQGNSAATFIFKVGSTLTTASSASVSMINGGNSCGVAWQVGSSATLGTTTSFMGNLIALTSITLNTGASVIGRVLARTGAVTLDTNTVSFASCGGSAPSVPTLSTWMTLAIAGLLGLAGALSLRGRSKFESPRV